MKKLLIILITACSALVSLQASAQTQLWSQYGLTGDTVLTGNLTKYLTVQAPVSGIKIGTVNFWTSKISGTVSATATLQYSTDGTNYYSIPRDSVYTLTDVSAQNQGWHLPEFVDKWVRIKFVGTGTMSTKIFGNYVFLKPN